MQTGIIQNPRFTSWIRSWIQYGISATLPLVVPLQASLIGAPYGDELRAYTFVHKELRAVRTGGGTWNVDCWMNV